MRRLVPSLIVVLVLLALVPVTSAAADPHQAVSLRLVSQTPWVTADHPVVRLSVRAINEGDTPLGRLSLSVTLLSPVRSRSAYEQSLRTDPDGSVTLLTPPPLELEGTLRPGGRRTITPKPLDVGFLAGSGSFVYPLRVELRSGFRSIATLRTPLVFLSLPPGRDRAETPLKLSWSFVLDAPVLHGPGGSFDQPAVSSLLDPGGRLQREVKALSKLTSGKHPPAVDVAVGPLLLQQLDRLSRGYAIRGGGRVPQGRGTAAVAASLLDHLRTVLRSPSVEVSTLPFASPNLPALVSAGLQRDLAAQVTLGREEIRQIAGVTPVPTLIRPSGSLLDQASLARLAAEGFRDFLIDPGMITRPPQAKAFTQPATAALGIGPEPPTTVTAVVPDEGIESLLSSRLPGEDPRLAAQAVLGELAQIWLEQPGVERAVSLALDADMPLPGSLFGPLVKRLSAAPWLGEENVTSMARRFPPSGPPATLVPRDGEAFPDEFVSLLDHARRDLDRYRSMLAGPSPLPRELESNLLTAEAGSFASPSISGAAFAEGVRRRLQDEFHKVGLEAAPLFTLPSRGGDIPVGITSTTGYPVQVDVRLISNHLEISQQTRRVEVRHRAFLPFRVHAKTTGRFPVQVQVVTPSGFTIERRQIVVRSTAYNLVALVVTIGAALFLLLWWARRFLPRKTA